MKTFLTGGACALPLLLAALPAHADETGALQHAAPDGHAPAGVMVDHVHKSGDVMIGVVWTHERFSGANYRGNRKASDAEIVAAGYTTRAKDMTMDMVMGHVMWAPADRVTLMVMPMWMRMEMTMLGIGTPAMEEHDMAMSAAAMDDGHHHHMLMPGETMRHAVSGIGDTKAGALVALSRNPKLSAHLGLIASIPTGSVSKKTSDGNFVHYGMQPGSGTWDAEPSLTVKGAGKGFSWGAQVSYVDRLEHNNDSGYRLGNRFGATAWLAKPIGDRLSLSGRLVYSDQGKIKGHYNSGHNHAAPPDRQENYGGQVLEAGLGANLVVGEGLRIGAEATVPLHQDVNGYQLRKDYGLALNVSHAF